MKTRCAATSCRLPYVQHVATCVLPAGAECRAAEAQPRTAEPPSQLRERYELAMTLSRALDPLPMAQRTAFILCEVEERSSQETAEILSINPGAVRARVFAAKRTLTTKAKSRCCGAWLERAHRRWVTQWNSLSSAPSQASAASTALSVSSPARGKTLPTGPEHEATQPTATVLTSGG